jgi:hypothetical protein
VSRELTRFYRHRFDALRSDLKNKWAVESKSLIPVEADLRAIHRRYLGLACLSTLVAQNSRRNDYIRGLAEVSYLSIVLAVKGLENPASVLLLQSIELALKHIYFSTHPVEFGWSLTRHSYREISFQFLLEYIRKTDESSTFSNMVDVLTKLEGQFHVLSRFVHMHSRNFIPYQGSRDISSAHVATIAALKGKTTDLWPLIISLLITFFSAKFIGANANEKKIISSAAGSAAWRNLGTYLRTVSIR